MADIEPESSYPRLAFYWLEPDDDRSARGWGELAGATHRLQAVSDELENLLTSQPPLEAALQRLSYHVENFLVRTYELRERLILLVGAAAENHDAAGALKSPQKRAQAWAELGPAVARFQEDVDRLLEYVDSDIQVRNNHTHQTFLRLGLYTGDDIHDPEDVLRDLEHNPELRIAVEGVFRKEIQRLVEEYNTKAETVVNAVWRVLDRAPHSQGTAG